jgi:hypothetical protein
VELRAGVSWGVHSLGTQELYQIFPYYSQGMSLLALEFSLL